MNKQHFDDLFDALPISFTSFLIQFESMDVKDKTDVHRMLEKCSRMYDSIKHIKAIINTYPSDDVEEDKANMKILNNYIDMLNTVSMQCITQDRTVVYKPYVKAWMIKPTDTKINVVHVQNLPSIDYAKTLGYKSEDDLNADEQWCFSLENDPSTVFLILHSKEDVFNKVATDFLDKVKNQNCFEHCKGTFLILKHRQISTDDINVVDTGNPSSRFEDMDIDTKTFIKEFSNYALRVFMKQLKKDFIGINNKRLIKKKKSVLKKSKSTKVK